VDETCPEQKRPADCRVLDRLVLYLILPTFRAGYIPAANSYVVGVCPQERDLFFQPLRERHVVVINARNKLAPCERKSPVKGLNDAPVVRVCDDSNPSILERAENPGCGVCGTVVNNEQLEIRKRLPQGAFDGFRHEIFAVIDRHDD
jgi:hypothetical protein